MEIRDDKTKLAKSANGLIELVLLSAADNIYCSGTLPKASHKTYKEKPTETKLQVCVCAISLLLISYC